MPDDLGPCHACPRATGVMAAPTGPYHTCPPDEWRVCNVLYRANMPATTNSRTPSTTVPEHFARRSRTC